MKEEIIVLQNINITPLIKAVKQFKKGLTQVKDQLDRDGVIQRFEFTFELIWKTLKRILAFKGINVNSPRDVFRESAKQKLINDPLVWFEFIKKRNLTIRTYNEEYANEIFECLPLFNKELDKVIENIKRL